LTDRRKDIMDKVTKLLSKAESTTFGPERDALLAKVEQFMTDYAIADWEISQAKPAERSKPVMQKFRISEEGSEIWDELATLAGAVASFFNCKSVFYGYSFKGQMPISVGVVGFPADVDSCEFLFNSLKLQLMANLEPKYDHSKTRVENMELLKMGGVKWERQHQIFVQAGVMPDRPWGRGIGTMFTKEYAEYCRKNDRPHIKGSPKNYRINFAKGFAEAISYRVYEIQAARRKSSHDEQTNDGTSVALVLSERSVEVSDMFSQMFPSLKYTKGRDVKGDSHARGQGQAAGNNADMGSARVGSRNRGALGR